MPATPINGERGLRLPVWLAPRPKPIGAGDDLKKSLRGEKLVTVCEEARCPNLADCFGRGVATFMLLGDICTRTCGFCAVSTGVPGPVDKSEPKRVADMVRRMGLRHAVLTSVDRDDLEDGGAGQFVAAIHALRETAAEVTVEVLIPDFGGSDAALDRVAASGPQVLNHNLETVRRLQGVVRPDGKYEHSLGVLEWVNKRYPGMLTKSGLMVGLGETDSELIEAFTDLAAAGCDILTLGQYLRPGRDNLPVDRYLSPEGFGELKAKALEIGFKHVAAAPLVRSSFNAGAVLKELAT